MAETLRKKSLIADLAAARDRLGGHSLGIRRNLSPTEALKRGIRQRPEVLFGGAILAGLLLSRIPGRRKKVNFEPPPMPRGKSKDPAKGAGQAAMAVTLLKFALDMAKPSLMRWVRERLAQSNGSKPGLSPRTAAVASPGLPPREVLGAAIASGDRGARAPGVTSAA